ncbi:MAG: serine/threonine-protein kinase [Planctomycetaceae bacterium]
MDFEQIGPYKISRKIGSGGMGTVYLGIHEETGSEAAVKVLPSSMSREEGFVHRFSREISALSEVSNPHIVRLLDSGADNKGGDNTVYYYAMEFVDGETLTDRLRREKRLPWADVIEISLQICTALKAAHDAGIIHRDLKPGNLLITKSGQIKLADFGVAQVFAGSKLTVTGGIVGTAEFMSPEQAKGQRATKQSDLYSLGAVMYVMLTGRPPFVGRTTLDLIHKHQYGQFDRPRTIVPDMPSWLDDIVCQLMSKNPDDRFPDAFVVSRQLQSVMKKVILSQDAPTIGSSQIKSATGGSNPTTDSNLQGVGPTLMRDLVRAEIERPDSKHPLATAFDNTWVLVAALVSIIVGGYFWFQSQSTSPEQMFDSGVALLLEPEGAGWLKAKDDYFLPLVESNSQEWSDRVAPYLDEIDAYEFRRQLTRGRGNSIEKTDPDYEPMRLLKMAIAYRKLGDVVQARRTLNALAILLESHTEYESIAQLVTRELRTLDGRTAQQTAAFVQSMLDNAARHQQDGHTQRATEIWRSLIRVYDDDESLADQVGQAQQLLRTAKPVDDAPPSDSGQ